MAINQIAEIAALAQDYTGSVVPHNGQGNPLTEARCLSRVDVGQFEPQLRNITCSGRLRGTICSLVSSATGWNLIVMSNHVFGTYSVFWFPPLKQ